MRVVVVCPPLIRTAHPDAFWVETAGRVSALGADVLAVDMNAHVVDRALTPEHLAPRVAPLLERYETLERKHRLTADDRRRYGALARVAPLAEPVLARIDAARRGLRDPASYVITSGARVPAVIGHRTVHDLAARLLGEALALETWRSWPAAVTLDPAPLLDLLSPVHVLPGRAAPVVLAVGWEVQLPFARALAAAWGARCGVVAVVLRRAPGEPLPEELRACPLEALSPEWLADPLGGFATEPALTFARAPWSSALRAWPDARSARAAGDPEAHVVVSCGASGTPVIEPGEPARSRRRLAAASGTDALAEPAVPHAGPGPRLLCEDAMQQVLLGAGSPVGACAWEGAAHTIPYRSAEAVVVRHRHDITGTVGVGVGRTAPEQMRGGLQRRRAAPLAVDLATGRVAPLSPDALAALDVVDGVRSVGDILSRLGATHTDRRARAEAALAELAAAGVIERRR